MLKQGAEGIGRFTQEVVGRMVKRNPNYRFTLIFDRPYHESFEFGEHVTPLVVSPPTRHPVLWYLWFHWLVPRVLRKIKPDIFFSPEFFLTTWEGGPQVPVFHDIGYEHFPNDIPWLASRYYRYYSKRYVKKAAHVLTVSQYSKEDLINTYKLTEEDISIVHSGICNGFDPVTPEVRQQTRDEFSEGQPYFLFVGTIQPRKNIESLLQAFDLFRTQTGVDVKLLVVGKKGWEYERAFRIYEEMDNKDDVIFTGFVSDEALGRIYGSALALTFLPHFEGFGLPVLEAMTSEIPVICSNVTSLPEVTGNAALQVNPLDITAITDAMKLIYRDPQLREELIEKGRYQRTVFSWDDTYEAVWENLLNVLKRT